MFGEQTRGRFDATLSEDKYCLRVSIAERVVPEHPPAQWSRSVRFVEDLEDKRSASVGYDCADDEVRSGGSSSWAKFVTGIAGSTCVQPNRDLESRRV